MKGNVNKMVDLRAKPYYLNDEDIAWVENTIASMTDEEKVGQLFWQLTSSNKEEYLKDLMETYHLGGCRYNGMPGQFVLNQNRILQKYAKVPVFIACNPEKGGDGVCSDGTPVAAQVKIGATGKTEYAHALGRLSNIEAAAMGMKAIASDFDEEMVIGCQENMDFYGFKLEDFEVLDIGDIGERFHDIDAVCTDPPYGRSTKTGGEPIDNIYRRAGEAIPKCLAEGGRAGVVLPHPISFDTMTLEGMYLQRVHGSLSRHYHIFRP